MKNENEKHFATANQKQENRHEVDEKLKKSDEVGAAPKQEEINRKKNALIRLKIEHSDCEIDRKILSYKLKELDEKIVNILNNMNTIKKELQNE